MQRIKVLHIIGGGEFGGAEQHLLTLISHLDKNEFEVHVACLFPKPIADMVRAGGFPCYVFPMESKFNFKPIEGIVKILKQEGFDIVHTHGVRANLMGRLAAKKVGNVHVVTTVHSVLAQDYKRVVDKIVNRISEKLTQRLTEKYITVCRMLEGNLIAEGIRTDKIITIHNGIEILNYRPLAHDKVIRKEFKIPAKATLISVVARLHPVKGHVHLLPAVANVMKNRKDVYLLLAGSGPCREELEKMVADLDIVERVIFAGFRKDIPNIIADSDVIVLPSLSEGLSLTIIEAMAMEKAVIATRVGGTPEIITHCHDGILVPAADPLALEKALEMLFEHKDLSLELGKFARHTVERDFTANGMATKTATVYKELLRDANI